MQKKRYSKCLCQAEQFHIHQETHKETRRFLIDVRNKTGGGLEQKRDFGYSTVLTLFSHVLFESESMARRAGGVVLRVESCAARTKTTANFDVKPVYATNS